MSCPVFVMYYVIAGRDVGAL